MPSLCRASLQCMVDGEVNNNIDGNNQQQTRLGGNIQVPLPLNNQDNNQFIQVYEDRNGKDVVDIMSENEDIKLYQNAAGEEVIEIASRNGNNEGLIAQNNNAKPQQQSSLHKIQRHFPNP